jgi:hypothetical protein
VDRVQGSQIHHLKELWPGSAGRSEIRVLFAFDPTRVGAAARLRQSREGAAVVRAEHPDRRTAIPEEVADLADGAGLPHPDLLALNLPAVRAALQVGLTGLREDPPRTESSPMRLA